MQRFLAELKRRKVLRVAGAYAVVAWGALQVAEKLFPALLLPHWLVPDETLPHVQRAVDELQPGDRLLLQAEALEVLAAYRARPSRDPLADPVDRQHFAPLQEWALKRIAQRFRVRVIHRDGEGFVVADLRAG